MVSMNIEWKTKILNNIKTNGKSNGKTTIVQKTNIPV